MSGIVPSQVIIMNTDAVPYAGTYKHALAAQIFTLIPRLSLMAIPFDVPTENLAPMCVIYLMYGNFKLITWEVLGQL
jgi:hypothetical protein